MIDQQRLQEVVNYNFFTGEFLWNDSGDVATSEIIISDVIIYKFLIIDGESILAHRAVMLYVDGLIPDNICHRDCNGLNNAYENLYSFNHDIDGVFLYQLSDKKWMVKNGNKYTGGFENFLILKSQKIV